MHKKDVPKTIFIIIALIICLALEGFIDIHTYARASRVAGEMSDRWLSSTAFMFFAIIAFIIYATLFSKETLKEGWNEVIDNYLKESVFFVFCCWVFFLLGKYWV